MTHSPKLLAVGLDKEELKVLTSIVTTAKGQIITAQNAAEALIQSLVQPFTMILINLEFSDKNGIELAQELRTRSSAANTPILFLFDPDRHTRHPMLDCEIHLVDYIERGRLGTQLTNKVQPILNRAQSQQQKIYLTQQLERCKARLHAQIQARELVQHALVNAQERLEQRVSERTQQLQNELEERQRIEMALRESEEKFRSIAESAIYAVVSFDSRGKVVFWNRSAESIFGFSSTQILGQSVNRLVPKQFFDLQQHAMNCITEPDPNEAIGQTQEVFARRRDKTVFPAEISLSSWLSGSEGYFTAIIRDISSRRRAQTQQRIAKTVYETVNEAIVVTDQNNRIIAVNPAFTQMTGYQEQEALGQNPSFLKSGRHDAAFYENLWHAIETNRTWEGEIWNRRKTGEIYPQWTSIVRIHNEFGQPLQHVAVFTDITERKQAEEVIHRRASYDAVTGLPNRNLFFDRLESAIKRCKRDDSGLALLFIDLDGFKAINDFYGHAIGDEVLQETGRRLQASIRQTDTAARLGGDEFTVILTDCNLPHQAELLGRKIIHSLSRSFVVEDLLLPISGSLGITLFPQDATQINTLIKNADTAMYRAKKKGGNQYCFFSNSINQQTVERINMENALRQVLQNDELFLHYQPVVHVATGALVGAEALLRWQHREHGCVLPEHFLPLAEEIGLAVPIGDWVIRSALGQFAIWRDRSIFTCDYPMQLSINISSRHLRHKRLPEFVASNLQRLNLQTEQLWLEVTENKIIRDDKISLQTMNQLEKLGVQIAVDDFGTGDSALGFLRRYPINGIKIDRAFIKDLQRDPRMVKTIISMAKNLRPTSGGRRGRDKRTTGIATSTRLRSWTREPL